jgi:hypothetical protein
MKRMKNNCPAGSDAEASWLFAQVPPGMADTMRKWKIYVVVPMQSSLIK